MHFQSGCTYNCPNFALQSVQVAYLRCRQLPPAQHTHHTPSPIRQYAHCSLHSAAKPSQALQQLNRRFLVFAKYREQVEPTDHQFRLNHTEIIVSVLLVCRKPETAVFRVAITYFLFNGNNETLKKEFLCITQYSCKKVKQSRYRPGVTQRVPGS